MLNEKIVSNKSNKNKQALQAAFFFFCCWVHPHQTHEKNQSLKFILIYFQYSFLIIIFFLISKMYR